ncbi:hypothetical protein [Moorena sp. SIO2C4]|nr:hypothetical protein [Moorena sp. SIO2C4]
MIELFAVRAFLNLTCDRIQALLNFPITDQFLPNVTAIDKEDIG